MMVSEDIGPDRLRFTIVDSGPGIAPEHVDKLFQPFERLGAETGVVEGTGIGLALSRGLVELMAGEMGVETEPGTGSRFWFELPKAVAPVEAAQREGAVAVDSAERLARTATVVYVEDNLSNLMLVEAILGLRPRIKLIPAMQGRLAVDLVREHSPDLILLDVNLPDLSGYEVCKLLKADPATALIPVVVVSADAMPAQIERMMDAGAAAYLTKPLNVRTLLHVVDGLLATTEGS